MQPKRRAVIHTIARSRTYSHSLVDKNYGTRKNSNTQTDFNIWRNSFFDQEIQFDSYSKNFSEESRIKYRMALDYVNRYHHAMNHKLKYNSCKTNGSAFEVPDIPDYSSLFLVLFQDSESIRYSHQSNHENKSPGRKDLPTFTPDPIPEEKKNQKYIAGDACFQQEIRSFRHKSAEENQREPKNYSQANASYTSHEKIPRKEQSTKRAEASSIISDKKPEQQEDRTEVIHKHEQGQNSLLDFLKEHISEEIWNSFLKLKPKTPKEGKLVKSCFNIVNIQPHMSLIDYAQKKNQRNVNSLSVIKNKDRACPLKRETSISSPRKLLNPRPNTPIKVMNMFDKISKSKEKVASRKIFECKTFKIDEDESDTDSIIFDDIEFEKMSQKSRCVGGKEIMLFNKVEEKSKWTDNEKSNPLKLNGKDMSKLNEKMLSAIGLFTERGDIRPGVIDILEEHKKLKSNDTRNKQFRSKRQWDIQIHLKPKMDQSSLPSVSSDKSFISLSSDIRLQVKNVKSQFHEIDKKS